MLIVLQVVWIQLFCLVRMSRAAEEEHGWVYISADKKKVCNFKGLERHKNYRLDFAFTRNENSEMRVKFRAGGKTITNTHVPDDTSYYLPNQRVSSIEEAFIEIECLHKFPNKFLLLFLIKGMQEQSLNHLLTII